MVQLYKTMKNDLYEINTDKFNSDVKCEFFTNDDNDILLVKVQGNCQWGSKGSIDVNKIFTLTSGYFFLVEPLILVFDLSQFHYEWCNTLLKILKYPEVINNADPDLKVFFIISEKNDKAIASLLNIDVNNFPENYYRNYEELDEKMAVMIKEYYPDYYPDEYN